MPGHSKHKQKTLQVWQYLSLFWSISFFKIKTYTFNPFCSETTPANE